MTIPALVQIQPRDPDARIPFTHQARCCDCGKLIEWWVAMLSDEAADSFLGTQGYIWDTQSDMALALVGAIAALVMLSNVHDKQLRERGLV